MELARPHVSSDTYLDSLQYRKLGTLGILATEHVRGCHLEYSIHGKELGSNLLRHRIKTIQI